MRLFSDFKIEEIIFFNQKTKICFLGLGVKNLVLTVGRSDFNRPPFIFSLGHIKLYNNYADYSGDTTWMNTFNLNLHVK